jgi:tetratricopeptide (TPR) repeat protein
MRRGTKGPRGQGFRGGGLLVACAVALLFGSTWATSVPDLFARGNQAYEAGDYVGAVAAYDSALAGRSDATLFYNRGNAFFKQGMVGRAIADYCRAYALQPQDRDIRHNLSFARAFRPDKTLSLDNPLVKLVAGFLRLPNVATARMVAGLAFLLAMACLALFFVSGRQPAAWAAAGLGVVFLYFLASWASWGGEVNPGHAVVVVPELTLRSGPGPEYKEIAVVHDGLEGSIREARPGYVLIQMPGGLGGWVETASVERIFPRGI